MKSFEYHYYFPVLKNINNIYQKNKSINSMWKYVDKEFLHDLYSCKSMPYHEAIRRYINLVIQKKLASETKNSYALVSGKILALLVDDQLDDGMAEGATQGFFDACDTPHHLNFGLLLKMEFYIHLYQINLFILLMKGFQARLVKV